MSELAVHALENRQIQTGILPRENAMFGALKHVTLARQPLPAEENGRELILADLDAAAGGGSAKSSGGKLFQSCCTGRHFSEATLHV